ncbi:MAG: winged helix-turn-helix transcriptional regulator [Bacteroidia bacterium]|nr:winged helix-turn-helix transcriptional regulator [Bacteroidia bacterium]
MGRSKTNLFTPAQNRAATLAKALGHPARIAILEYLVQADQCINGDLVEEIGLAQATISQHLKELKNAGLIHGTISGTAVCYCVNPTGMEELKGLFGNLTDLKQLKNNCC